MKAITSANETALEAEVDLFAAASDPIRIVPLQLPPELTERLRRPLRRI